MKTKAQIIRQRKTEHRSRLNRHKQTMIMLMSQLDPDPVQIEITRNGMIIQQKIINKLRDVRDGKKDFICVECGKQVDDIWGHIHKKVKK